MKTENIIWLTVFSIAMGLLESAVVVYLRELYYPNGFSFPLVIISNRIALTEIFRESATIVMLLGIAFFTGKNFITRFGSFLYAFAIWDIFYYVFLWLILGWPESLFTWDILFLIPIIWVGPVISPVIISVTMIIFAFVLWNSNRVGKIVKISKSEWVLLISGSLVLILSFTLDLMDYLYTNYTFKEIVSFMNENLIKHATHYIPEHFNWFVFVSGELLLILSIWIFSKKVKALKKNFKK